MFSRTISKLFAQDVRCRLSAIRKTCNDRKENNNDVKVKGDGGDRSWMTTDRRQQLDRPSKLKFTSLVPVLPLNAIPFQLLCDVPYQNAQCGADNRLLGQVSPISGNWKAPTKRWMLPTIPVKNLIRYTRTTSGENPPRREPVSYPKEKGFFRSADDPWLEKTRQRYKKQFAKAASKVERELNTRSKSKIKIYSKEEKLDLETEIKARALATPALSQIPRQQNELRRPDRYTLAKTEVRTGVFATERKKPKEKEKHELRTTSIVYSTKRKPSKSLLQELGRTPLKRQTFLQKEKLIFQPKRTPKT